MQTIEDLKSEIIEIEECLTLGNTKNKQTSFEQRMNTYLEKKLQEKKKELVDRQK